MRAIPQLVSAPLNLIPIAEHFRRRKITQSKIKTFIGGELLLNFGAKFQR